MSRPAVGTALPIAGNTAQARHASATGAAAAATTRDELKRRYWLLFVDANGRAEAWSDHSAAVKLGIGAERLSSINSTRNQLAKERAVDGLDAIVHSGTYETNEVNGVHTKRSKWIRRDLLQQFLEQLDRDEQLTEEIRAHIDRVRKGASK